MLNSPPTNDPRTIWQNQPTEPTTMTLNTIRQKTKELHAKTRRALLRGMTVPLLVAGICGWTIAELHGGLALGAIVSFAVAWSLAGQYFLNRGMWSATPPADAGLSTGIDSYRREVERWRHLSASFLLWSLGPVVLALAACMAPLLSLGIRSGMLLNMIPFLALVVAWILGVFIIRMRDRRALQLEIDELNAIERA